MRQQMLGPLVRPIALTEEFPDHKINHLQQGLAVGYLEMFRTSWAHLGLRTGRPRIGADETRPQLRLIKR